MYALALEEGGRYACTKENARWSKGGNFPGLIYITGKTHVKMIMLF